MNFYSCTLYALLRGGNVWTVDFFQIELVLKLVRPQPLDSTGVQVRSALRKTLGIFKYTKLEIVNPREFIIL